MSLSNVTSTTTRHNEHDSSSSNNNENDDDDNDENDFFPWSEWLDAAQAIVDQDPVPNIPKPPVALNEWLYLSPMYSVLGSVEDLGITHVLSTNRMPPKVLEDWYWKLKSLGIDHYSIPANDFLGYDLLSNHWEECRDFIQRAREEEEEEEEQEDEEEEEEASIAATTTTETKTKKNKKTKILVHCAAGMNRSGTIAAAALLYFEGQDTKNATTLLEVVRRLKASRGYVLNNKSFLKQLVRFAAEHDKLGPLPSSTIH